MFAPAGTPRDIVSRLSRELISALSAPDLRERLAALDVKPWPGTSEELEKLLREDIERYATVACRACLRRQ